MSIVLLYLPPRWYVAFVDSHIHNPHGDFKSNAVAEADCDDAWLQVCTSQLGYTPLSSRLCNTFTCNTTADCSNNGVCNTTTSACQCQSGYTGPNCAISTGLCNTTATASNATTTGNSTDICCSTGIVNSNGTCCTSGLSLLLSFFLEELSVDPCELKLYLDTVCLPV